MPAKVCNLSSCSAPATKTCAACKSVGYCSQEHQKADWPQHKAICKKVKADRFQKKDEVAVLWPDQQLINEFASLTQERTDLVEEIDELKKEVAQLKDGQGDIEILLDDDACKIKIGECFLAVSNEDAEEHVDGLLKETEATKNVKSERYAAIETRMTEIKAILYKKFGNQINLEEDNKHVK